MTAILIVKAPAYHPSDRQGEAAWFRFLQTASSSLGPKKETATIGIGAYELQLESDAPELGSLLAALLSHRYDYRLVFPDKDKIYEYTFDPEK